MSEIPVSDFEKDATNAIDQWCRAAIDMNEVPQIMYVFCSRLAALIATSPNPDAFLMTTLEAVAKMSQGRERT
jgi:hypothetical protein